MNATGYFFVSFLYKTECFEGISYALSREGTASDCVYAIRLLVRVIEHGRV